MTSAELEDIFLEFDCCERNSAQLARDMVLYAGPSLEEVHADRSEDDPWRECDFSTSCYWLSSEPGEVPVPVTLEKVYDIMRPFLEE